METKMAKKQLHVVEVAYRATIEEQDDPIVWLCHAMRGAGAELDLLLCGNAIGYGVRRQGVPPVALGARHQTRAPDLAGDLARLLAKRVAGYYVEEDAAERGIDGAALLDGLVPVSRAKLPNLFAGYDQVHRW
jgi:hypothetical protein